MFFYPSLFSKRSSGSSLIHLFILIPSRQHTHTRIWYRTDRMQHRQNMHIFANFMRTSIMDNPNLSLYSVVCPRFTALYTCLFWTFDWLVARLWRCAVEVTEPHIADLSEDKCRGVLCQQSCDAAVGSCICHDGYTLQGAHCEGLPSSSCSLRSFV